MAYDEGLAERVRAALGSEGGVTEKKMFGGLCFMLGGNMCCGVEKERLVLRVGADNYEETLKLEHALTMDFTGRPLKGFVYVSPAGLKTEDSVTKWVTLALNFTKTLPPKKPKK